MPTPAIRHGTKMETIKMGKAKIIVCMKNWEIEEIKRLEKERDRNLAIHCNYVAAKYQRMIDKIKKEDENYLNRNY